VGPLLEDVRKVNYSPLLAETLFAAAYLSNSCSDQQLGLKRYREAFSVALLDLSEETLVGRSLDPDGLFRPALRDSDWSAIGQLVVDDWPDARGYDDFISVEWEKKWHPEIAEPEVAFPQHLALLQDYVRDFG